MPLITPETAREMQARGRLAIQARENLLRDTIATLVADPGLDFHIKRLARVRAQLTRIDDELEGCSFGDSKRIKDLTDAQLRLSEQERILAGRPLPGSRRPVAEAVDKRPTIELVAAPVSQVAQVEAPVAPPVAPKPDSEQPKSA